MFCILSSMRASMAALHSYVCAVMACCVLVTTAAAYYDQNTAFLQQVPGVLAPDSETSFFLIPRLAHKYRPQTGYWIDISDPRLYLLAENENEELQARGRRITLGWGRRTGFGATNSVMNPLEILRQRMLVQIARRRRREYEKKIEANRKLLEKIGKRSVQSSSLEDDDQKIQTATYPSKAVHRPSGAQV